MRKEVLTPDPDGVRVDFQTQSPYKSGSVSVWINGLRRVAFWADGFTEMGGKVIRMNEPPEVGDSVQAQYTVGGP